MKITFVTKVVLPGSRGVCFAIAAMCQAMVENGHKVDLVFPDSDARLPIPQDFWDYFQIKKNLYQITRLPVMALPGVKVLESFQEIVRSWSFSLTVFGYLYFNHRSYIHLFTECKELLLLLRIFRWFYNPKVVYEIHIPPQIFYDKVLDYLSASRADLVVATTLDNAKYYQDCAKKIIISPSAVDLGNFDYKTSKRKLRQKLGIPVHRIIIGYGGRFVTASMEKGIPQLIKSVAILRKRFAKNFLLCVGGPEEFVKKYQSEARENGLAKNDAVFLGHIPPRVLYQYMRCFDICVMPFPRNWHFAHVMSPLKMFEYMASKNPIVATNLPSVRQILTDGKTALLAKPGDPKDLARNIETLLRDSQLGKRLAYNAYVLVASRYTWQKRQAKIVAEVAS